MAAHTSPQLPPGRRQAEFNRAQVAYRRARNPAARFETISDAHRPGVCDAEHEAQASYRASMRDIQQGDESSCLGGIEPLNSADVVECVGDTQRQRAQQVGQPRTSISAGRCSYGDHAGTIYDSII